MGKIGICIVDDHKLIRQGLIDFLGAYGEFEVKGEAVTGEEAVLLAKEVTPDVILMDLNMEGMGGVEAIREIKSSNPDIKIIALTAYTQNEKVFSAIDAGADGYLLKDILPDELIAAIYSVLNGKPALHPDIAWKLMYNVSTKNDRTSTVEVLTPREQEVLQLIAEGKSDREIAEALIISLLTVKTHVHNILSKLHMTKRVQAALFAMRKFGDSEE